MKQVKRLFAIALMAFASLSASAQENLDYKPYPHIFLGIQGGAQTTWTNYDQLKLVTPTASLYFGSWFTPVVGARLHVNGIWNKSGYDNGKVPDFEYKYKYVTTDLDLMINLFTLFGKKDYYPFNIYLIGGMGLNCAWDNDEAYAQKAVLPIVWDGKRLSHNARIGAMFDLNLCKHWSLNLEVAANSLSDRYNSKCGNRDDWSLTAQLGLTYKFGFKKKEPEPVVEAVVAPVIETEAAPEPVWATRIDTIWYDDVEYKDVTADRDIKKEIFFGLKQDGVSQDQAQIKAVADFLKGVKDGEITITSYADKGTGNPKLNLGYSKKRAENTRKALIDHGVDPKMIKTVEWKGDTVQPYPNDNDKNRLSVITGHGVYTDKEKVVTKKFRTKEVRYQVK